MPGFVSVEVCLGATFAFTAGAGCWTGLVTGLAEDAVVGFTTG
jgi:hypothetical protein